MSVTWLRDTTSYMAGVGVALQFWLRIERERVARGWSSSRLSTETARWTPTGRPIPRSTIDNLRVSTRAPQPYIVQALSNALGIDYEEEGAVLAGLLPAGGDAAQSDVPPAIKKLELLSDAQQKLVESVIDELLAASQAKPRTRRRSDTGRSDDERRAI